MPSSEPISPQLLATVRICLPVFGHDFVLDMEVSAYGEVVAVSSDLQRDTAEDLLARHGSLLSLRQYQFKLLEAWLKAVVPALHWIPCDKINTPAAKLICEQLEQLREQPTYRRQQFKKLSPDSWAAKFYRLKVLRSHDSHFVSTLAGLFEIGEPGAAESIQELTNMQWEEALELANLLLPIYRQRKQSSCQAKCFLPFLYFHTPRAYDLLLHYRRLRIYSDFDKTILTALSNHQHPYLRELFLNELEKEPADRVTDTTLIYGLRYYREPQVQDVLIELLVFSHNDQRYFASTPRLVFQYLQEWGMSQSEVVNEVWAITIDRPNTTKVVAALGWLMASQNIGSITKEECFDLFTWYWQRHDRSLESDSFMANFMLRSVPYFTFGDITSLVNHEVTTVRLGLVELMRRSVQLTKSPVNKTAAIQLLIRALGDVEQAVRLAALRQLQPIAVYYNINTAQDALLDLFAGSDDGERELALALLKYIR